MKAVSEINQAGKWLDTGYRIARLEAKKALHRAGQDDLALIIDAILAEKQSVLSEFGGSADSAQGGVEAEHDD